jgi:hypothetical protein
MSVILATHKAEIGRMEFEGQPRQKKKKKRALISMKKTGCGGMCLSSQILRNLK